MKCISKTDMKKPKQNTLNIFSSVFAFEFVALVDMALARAHHLRDQKRIYHFVIHPSSLREHQTGSTWLQVVRVAKLKHQIQICKKEGIRKMLKNVV